MVICKSLFFFNKYLGSMTNNGACCPPSWSGSFQVHQTVGGRAKVARRAGIARESLEFQEHKSWRHCLNCKIPHSIEKKTSINITNMFLSHMIVWTCCYSLKRSNTGQNYREKIKKRGDYPKFLIMEREINLTNTRERIISMRYSIWRNFDELNMKGMHQDRKNHIQICIKTLQELLMLSSVTINCQVTKIVINQGSQLSVL